LFGSLTYSEFWHTDSKSGHGLIDADRDRGDSSLMIFIVPNTVELGYNVMKGIE